MLIADLPLLACPHCGAAALAHRATDEKHALPPGFDPALHLWEGALACGACGRDYPLLEGVACLGVLNRDWRVPLKETASKLSLSMRLTRVTSWESGRAEVFAEQIGEVAPLMDHLFECALAEMDFSNKPKILDLGCGGGVTTGRFIALGARAVGVDADLGLLRHVSFKGIDALPPGEWRHPASGHAFHEKNTRPLDHYFTRVLADISRLPFPEGAFDIVFCRSVLHHLDDHRRVLRGAMRALRPGGRVVFCSEPMRSILTIESESMSEQTVDCEEGMNERVWPLWHYLAPVWPLTRGVMVQTWPDEPAPSLARRTLGLARVIKKRISPGARVRGWQLPALALVDASFNLFAERNEARVEPAAHEPELSGAEFNELVGLFRVRPGEGAAGPADLPRKRAVVDALRRRVMTLGEPPEEEIILAGAPQHALENGWLRRERAAGREGRLASWDAAVFLGRCGGARSVVVTAAGAVEAPVELRVEINEVEAGAATVAPGAWGEFSFSIPASVRETILTVRLFSASPGASDAAAPPLIVEKIANVAV